MNKVCVLLCSSIHLDSPRATSHVETACLLLCSLSPRPPKSGCGSHMVVGASTSLTQIQATAKLPPSSGSGINTQNASSYFPLQFDSAINNSHSREFAKRSAERYAQRANVLNEPTSYMHPHTTAPPNARKSLEHAQGKTPTETRVTFLSWYARSTFNQDRPRSSYRHQTGSARVDLLPAPSRRRRPGCSPAFPTCSSAFKALCAAGYGPVFGA